MSKFGGTMNEYSKISIDKFNGKNLDSTTYFLSHCHSDHMEGLKTNDFFQRLRKSSIDIHLYTSKITRDILSNDDRYSHLEPFIDVLEIEAPKIIKIPNENGPSSEVTVTLLAAGHCPGSVMFLFEGDEGTVLYTGDFRWPSKKQSRYLKSGDDVKKIDSLYLDTTFCVPSFLRIPERETSCASLIKFTKQKLLSRNNVVRLVLPAQYGYEHLFVELYNALKQKIHVDSSKISQFLDIDSISEAITEDPCTRIHACYSKLNCRDNSLPCGYSTRNMNVVIIKVSAMWFAELKTLNDPLVLDEKEKIYRLFYSTHSSLEEVCDFVSDLSPHKIYPNVVPIGSSEKQVLDLLDKYRKDVGKEEKSTSHEIITLGSFSRAQNYEAESSQSTDLLFDMDLCSPIKDRLTKSRKIERNNLTDSETENEVAKSSQSPDLFDLTDSTTTKRGNDSSDSTLDEFTLDSKTKRGNDSGDSTPDEFTPDKKSSSQFKFVNGKLDLIADHNVKRRKLFSN
uniref:Protein artemis n=1 Tax=Strigamia maritima TaxID=126957 RepID=T1J2U6_STRMM